MVSKYKDVLKGDPPVATIMIWHCPKIPLFIPFDSAKRCIIKVIMHGPGNKLLEDALDASTSLLPDFICDMASSLHVYDNSYIASIPAPAGWENLRWCRVERCPKVHTVFNVSQGSKVPSFRNLETLWISELLTARYILDRACSLSYLKFLHLDCCPMLLHVLPANHLYPFCLETLEIVYCGDLREIFPLSLKLQEYNKVTKLPDLRNIHLHELPSLQRICGRRMSAPNLETIKIRGCWSLKRLPAIGPNTKPPKVDCEKEWWDNLEWDGLEENHHPSLYQLSHSLYHKAQLPRVSILR
ncbi:uncharacterized protein LOC124675896 isoform X2 [Lolium rigidum]|uniref:uncharacterized protein LOC124675896 isoform X1 n=1 Tax=Lolium rigidum TaxID=89674 RepID=UPI001F5D55CA|nr:uncharacterized protein LOC124675896 isoform X1 [Lolium rigidum]XP_047067927.1 uncharacterized protein LOC124675896 isoform X2 [Lolium rigidum]